MHTRTAANLLKKIRELRIRSGKTQEAFAEEADISYKYYQAVEAGRKVDLRLSTIERLAHAHGMEPWQLLLPGSPSDIVGELMAADGPQAEYGGVTRKKKRGARR